MPRARTISQRAKNKARGALWKNGRCYFRLEDLWIWLTVELGKAPANKGELMEPVNGAVGSYEHDALLTEVQVAHRD